MAKEKVVGAIVLATDQGLGYLAKDFFDNGIIDFVYIKDHSSRTNHFEWYPKQAQVSIEELLQRCDVLLFFETVFDWKIIARARMKGIKTVLMPMYECTPDPMPYEPDMLICPSLLDYKYYMDKHAVILPVPVTVPWKKRYVAKTFVHNAGNGGLGGRNGTAEVLEAMKLVKSPIRLIIRSQVPLKVQDDPRIELRVGQFPKEELFTEGDVFLFPEKFNGLSLPLQEAFASGMGVMAGNRFPINGWLPREMLIEVDHYTLESITRRKFDCAHYSPATIAACIDWWYGKKIESFSHLGQLYSQKNSWKKLKKDYLDALSSK